MGCLHFSFPVFKARKQLTAIDWNSHKDMPANECENRPGEVMVTRKYNQRTKRWDSKIIKKFKDYTYISLMMAKVLDARMVHKKRVTRQVPSSADDPRRVRKTIAEVAPEESKDIHKKKSEQV